MHGRGARLPAGRQCAVDGLQNILRSCADAEVAGQVHPADRACGVHQELGGAGDILVVHAGARMEHAETADYLGFGIGEEGKGVAAAVAKLLGILARINADGDHLDAARMKILQAFFKPPQLGVAERSPVAAVEDEHRGAILLENAGERHRLAGGVSQREIGRLLAGMQRGGCRG